ncbi:hypothetical protein J31TS4_02880 [Paenibacillus sp. J31TS4]|uniref:MFS transporter n=1 Tax=Paenibacillus sp. J31TS4 TaxID=2807195 RepID=UPI001B11CB7E|nr:MFS transporter [Paenibacillus sp. J31TS4]GIP37008.1 hypothetical protein J31TS4_02880 [Paenibacillus sp. J31TS4]
MNLQQEQRLWTKSFISLTVSYFLLFLCLQMLLSPFPSYVKEAFQPSDFAVSLVTSLFALSAVITRFVTAALLKKVHRNIILMAGLVIGSLSTIAYPHAGSMAAVLLLRIGFGIGFGMASTVMPTMVSQIIPPRRIGEGIGYFGLSNSLAMSIGPLIGLWMIGEYGFGSLSAWGAAAVAIIIPLLLVTRSIPPQPSKVQPVKEENRKQGEKRGLSGKLVLPAILNLLLSITYGGLVSFLALFGKEINVNQVGLFFLFNALTVVLVRPFSGRLFDSKGHKYVLIPGCLAGIGGLYLLSMTHSLPMLIGSALLYGVAYGSIQPTIQAWMLRESHPEAYGAVNSLFYNSIDLGIAIGAMLLGTIAAATSYGIMYRYASGFMVLFFVLYAMALLVRGDRTAMQKKLG